MNVRQWKQAEHALMDGNAHPAAENKETNFLPRTVDESFRWFMQWHFRHRPCKYIEAFASLKLCCKKAKVSSACATNVEYPTVKILWNSLFEIAFIV